MKHVILLLGLSGFALCGSLSNEYLPANAPMQYRQISKPFGPISTGGIGTYSPTSRSYAGGNIRESSALTPQYGVPIASSVNRHQQYRKPVVPQQAYGLPSQQVGISRPQLRSQSLFQTQYSAPTSNGQYSTSQLYNSPATPKAIYGAPSQQFGVSATGPSTSFFANSKTFPQSQYDAPSFSGQNINSGISTFPSGYNSQLISSPFRAEPQHGSFPSSRGSISSAYRPGTPISSGTIQDSNGGYIY